MTRIAHLTDLHLLEPEHASRSVAGRLRLEYLSLGRPLDAAARRERLARALDAAWLAHADHVCLTGDLTEDGDDAQFDVLADVLVGSRFKAEQLTLVPGNHDAYSDGDAWGRALNGPLAPWAATSAVGNVVDLGDALVVPVSTMIAQPVTRAAGAIDAMQLAHLDRLLRDPGLRDRAHVVAQHHPPMRHCLPGLQWIDGLVTHVTMRALVEASPHAFVLYGHTHHAADRTLRAEHGVQGFCAEAVVESDAPLRVYDVNDRRLVPVTLAASTLPAYAPLVTDVRVAA